MHVPTLLKILFLVSMPLAGGAEESSPPTTPHASGDAKAGLRLTGPTTYGVGEENAIGDAPFLVLSAETNSLRCGLFIGATNHTLVVRDGRLMTEVSFAVLNTSTNTVRYYWPGEIGERLDMNMVDSTGTPVAKTRAGKGLGLPSSVPKNTPVRKAARYGLDRAFITPKADHLFRWREFPPAELLSKHFQIEKTGTYKLTLWERIYTIEATTNGYVLSPIVFQPIAVDVRVESSK